MSSFDLRVLVDKGKAGVRSLGFLAFVFSLLGAANSAFAQNTNSGEIRGEVTDPSAAIIPGTTVTIVEVNTGVTKQLITNNDGIYDAVSILPGTYKITFHKEGFKDLIRDGIVLQVGAITVDARLAIGSSSQQVEVNGQAVLLQTESGEQGTIMQSATMAELPNVGEDWANFTKTLPGTSGTGTAVAVNGNMPYNSNFLSDGGSITYPQSSNVDTGIFETIAEVQINTSTFDAQYGIGGSVFNQITKSGTNHFHGSAYDYLENNFFNARDFFSPIVPNLRYDRYGGSVGGPILKNKMFFYFNVDRLIDNSTAYTYYTFPTAAMKAGNFSSSAFPTIYNPASLNTQTDLRQAFLGNQIPASQMDPLAVKVQSYFPTPNLPGVTNNWLGALTTRSPLNRFFGRIDYNISDAHRLTFTILQSNNPAFYPSPDCPIDCEPGDVDAYQAEVSEVWTISATTVNEFRFAFLRQGNWFTPEALGKNYPQTLGWQYAYANLFPSLMIGGPVGATSIGASATAVNATLVENTFEPSDVVTMIRGKHVLKFGGELLDEQDNSTQWGNVQAGQFNFSGVFTAQSPYSTNSGLGYADFLTGQVASWSATNTPEVGVRMKSPQMFVEDDYKVLPNLTLNLGLRYQIQGGWSEVANRLGVFDPTIPNTATNTVGAMWFAGENGRTALQAPIYNTVLPRFGFAWSPRSKWSVRGGFGMYTYLWSVDNYGENALGFGSGGTGSLASSNQLEPVFAFLSANPPLNYVAASRSSSAYNGHAVNYYPYNTPLTKSYEWSFSLQRQMADGWVAEAAYVGNHGTGLPFPVDYNQVPENLLAANPTNEQANRPFPQFLGINGDTYNAISNYDSLQLSLKKRFSRGFSFDANYTWSKFLDDQDSSGWGRIAGSPVYQNAYNPALNYGYSIYDVPQAFKGDVVYQLPFGKGKQFADRGGVLDALIGGWQASAIFTLQAGTPFTPVMGTANLSGAAPNSSLYLAGFSAAESWYPNVVGNPSVSNPTVQRWFNTGAFAEPSPYTFGNAGRNILFGPGSDDVDFSMGKSFRIPFGEATQLQIRFDANNFFNHPNFSNPNAQIGTPNAGIITSTLTGEGRVLQLGARLSF